MRITLVILLLTATSWATTTPQKLLADASLILPGNAQNELVSQKRSFKLREIYHHGLEDHAKVHRKVRSSTSFDPETTKSDHPLEDKDLEVWSQSMRIQRMRDRDRVHIDRLFETTTSNRRTGPFLSWVTWNYDHVAGPNVTDKDTVLSFARMAANAYVSEPRTGDWRDVGSGFNYTEDFGWKKDGLRGHVFADTDNSTIVISMKGTSLWLFSSADTSTNDRFNDNLLGSCCCGQGGQYLWEQVCDCQTSANTCNSTCLSQEVNEKGRYYWAARDMYHNITAHYPNAEVWLTGHSLGGVIASLLGLTYGLPTLTFEAFPDALAAGRLGLPTPPGYRSGRHQDRRDTGIYHFGQTADPIFMGTCNTAVSSCTIFHYALESQCHTGQRCVYDTVTDLGFRVNIDNHRILSVIDNVLEPYETVANCTQDVDCIDCYKWNFVESNGTESSSSSSGSSSTTSAVSSSSTCTTPGWWGCLDPTTTSDQRVTLPTAASTTLPP